MAKTCENHVKIGMEVRGVYDGVLFWWCSNCGEAWHRWPEGSILWEKAKPYIASVNEKEWTNG